MSQKLKQDVKIAPNICNLKKEVGLTQEQVVAKLQILGLETSISSYSQIECDTYNLRISELIALAEIFKVDYDAFFETYKY